MGTHEQCLGATDEWYTPPYVFDALGCTFDLDVAHPGLEVVSWVPAKAILTDRSLESRWEGFVWMNPPFGGRNGIEPWLNKFMAYENGVALTPDRTSAPWWQKAAAKADALLFVAGKIKFIDYQGRPGKSPAQGTTLMASGAAGVNALGRASKNGLGLMTHV